MSQFEQMGKDFQELLKSFLILSDEMSKNSLLRVTKALMAYPLEDELIVLQKDSEAELYEIGKNIQNIKIGMMVESLQQDAEEDRIKQSKLDRNKVPDEIDKPDYVKQGE